MQLYSKTTNEFANKQNEYLANLLCRHSQAQIISTIKDNAGNLCHDNESINTVFRVFYKKHYTSQIELNQGELLEKNLKYLKSESIYCLKSKDKLLIGQMKSVKYLTV